MTHFAPKNCDLLTFSQVIPGNRRTDRQERRPHNSQINKITKKYSRQERVSYTNRAGGQWVDCIRSPGNWAEVRRLECIPTPIAKDAIRSRTAPTTRTQRIYCKIKPGFHYPSWRPELTARVDGWPVSITRQLGPLTDLFFIKRS